MDRDGERRPEPASRNSAGRRVNPLKRGGEKFISAFQVENGTGTRRKGVSARYWFSYGLRGQRSRGKEYRVYTELILVVLHAAW